MGQSASAPPWWLNYVTLALAVLGTLWAAATQWQALQDRVKMLESQMHYLHGMVVPPPGY